MNVTFTIDMAQWIRSFFFSPPAPIFSEPWRRIEWGDKQSALQYVKDYNPPTEGQQIRILLHGPVGAGKSSFINSVQSVLQGRMCIKTLVSTSQSCFTKRYMTYEFEKKSLDSFYPFVINDMMGLKDGSFRNQRVHVKDIKRALKGHILDGYRFNPESKLSKEDPYYNPSPGVNDKVHVLVSVIDANTVSQLEDKVVKAIWAIREEASELGIPQVAIFTKIDELCPEIQKDVRNVYKSKILKKAMQRFSEEVGIPMNCIFAVWNYHEDISLSNDNDALILSALTSIMNAGGDFLNTVRE
ncbi:interferon-induced protein 44-like isoform X1 [Cyclopterus lumpus]|uniref:G domain-containing protein n=2 Tax=Cyclopterus lumpus TaxID=8103 RepID=A0A8C2XLV9_CYCLU|nr:interferon-induced protein 44-like isoform X1 [Cyclopterus lumpus]